MTFANDVGSVAFLGTGAFVPQKFGVSKQWPRVT